MAIGDIYRVETGGIEDVHYVDVGLYDVPEYGSVYVIDDDRPALVDTGIGVRYETVLDAARSVGIAPEEIEVIAPTHVHLDHAGGTGYLVEACPNATVVCYERGVRHLVDPARLWEGTKRAVGEGIEFYAEPRPVPEDRIRSVTDGETVDLGAHALEVIHAPGHAPHHAVFHDPAADAVFTADAAGIYVPATDEVRPTTPPPNFHLERAIEDVERLRALDPGTLLYAHYGPAPAGDRLARYAETLTEWVDAVAAAHAELGDDEAVAERFADAADTVDVWGRRRARDEEALNVRGVLRYLDEHRGGDGPDG
ncbi:MAG: MBL fold metallo-hydrolase [Haloarculaceae archaeon]